MKTIGTKLNIPEEQHRMLKAKAALAGLTLHACLLELIRREVGGPAKK